MITILTGPVHSGKTTFLRDIVKSLQTHGTRPGGFLSVAAGDRRKPAGYDLLDAGDGETIPFIRLTGKPEWQQIGKRRRHFLLPEGLAAAERKIIDWQGSDLFVVDEVGPLELAGRGLWPALKNVLFPPATEYILVAREKILEDLKSKLEAERVAVTVLDVRDQAASRRAIEEIAAKGRRRNRNRKRPEQNEQ